jgi:hypothetical protein
VLAICCSCDFNELTPSLTWMLSTCWRSVSKFLQYAGLELPPQAEIDMAATASAGARVRRVEDKQRNELRVGPRRVIRHHPRGVMSRRYAAQSSSGS